MSPENQYIIIYCMKTLEYNYDENGMCEGLSKVGLIYLMSGKGSLFKDNVSKLRELFLSDFDMRLLDDIHDQQSDQHFLQALMCHIENNIARIELYRSELDGFFGKIDSLQANVEELSILSDAGIEKNVSFSGIYNTNELAVNFGNLEKILTDSQIGENYSLGIVLKNLKHAAAISYDLVHKKWVLIESHHLPYLHLSTVRLASKLKEIFSVDGIQVDENIVLSSTIYFNKKIANLMNHIIDQWKNTEAFQHIHAVTPEKVLLNNQLDPAWLCLAVENSEIEKIEQLINAGANINALSNEDMSALYVASEQNLVNSARVLLSHPDINVNIALEDGTTPLLFAAQSGYLELIKLLLQHPNININAGLADFNASPLMFAIENLHWEVAKLLIAHPQIDVNHPIIENNVPQDINALTFAVKNNNIEIIVLLLQRGATFPDAEGNNTKVFSDKELKNLKIIKHALIEGVTAEEIIAQFVMGSDFASGYWRSHHKRKDWSLHELLDQLEEPAQPETSQPTLLQQGGFFALYEAAKAHVAQDNPAPTRLNEPGQKKPF